ncbi:16S rRNA (guanine(527)-N(7))-methyltransferase RsmG [bacterium]|nr:16S rRNA (guanine(527)-N(7))-methyltransferase RsmG [bacterium]
MIEKKFKQVLNQWGIRPNEEIFSKFRLYYKELIAWNEKINITSICEIEEVYIKHFLDSISGCQVFSFNDQEIIDIGTGGGFPGLPLKIVFPDLKVTFVDSSKKKMMVLKEICQKLSIRGCWFASDNIEALGRSERFRGRYQVVVTRAVSTIPVLLEYGIPLLVEQGEIIIYKGPNVEKEVENSSKALQQLNAKIKKSMEFIMPFSDITRKLVVVEKTGKTPDEYPRKTGTPKKRPL